MNAPLEIYTEVFDAWGEETWDLEDFLRELNTAVEKIPFLERAIARVTLGGHDNPKLRIFYRHKETHAEMAARLESDKLAKEQSERASEIVERATFERLKRKYSGL